MGIKEKLSLPENRGALIAVFLLLGILATFPSPQNTGGWKIITGSWLAWSLMSLSIFIEVYKRDLRFGGRLGALAGSFAMWASTGYWLPLLLLSFSLIYLKMRESRVSKSKIPAVAAFLALSFSLGAQEPSTKPTYKLDQLASCGILNRIPWDVLRQDKRRVRKLFAEELRLSTDDSKYWWELFQVMSQNGEVTFVFRRRLADGRYLSYAVKDAKFAKVISAKNSGSRAIGRQKFTNLINRPTLIFYRDDGTLVNFLPGSMGKATIEIRFAKAEGRLLPPIFIRGNFCDRPESLADDDLETEQFGSPGSSVQAPGANRKKK